MHNGTLTLEEILCSDLINDQERLSHTANPFTEDEDQQAFIDNLTVGLEKIKRGEPPTNPDKIIKMSLADPT